MNVSLPTGVLSVDECIARGFNIVEHTLSGGSLKYFTLQVPFSDPSVQQRASFYRRGVGALNRLLLILIFFCPE